MAGICLVAVAAALVPMLLQLRRTLQRLEVLIDSLNKDIPPLTKSLNSTAERLDKMAEGVTRHVGQAGVVIDKLKLSADSVAQVTNAFSRSVTPLLIEISGFRAGLRAFSHFFTKR